MNTRLKLVSFLTLACLIISSLLWVKPFDLQPVSAASTAEIGGFLFPWTGVKSVTQGPSGHGYSAVDFVYDGTGQEHFPILAPKDGVVVMMDDSSNYGANGDLDSTCATSEYAMNYIVLGHGPFDIKSGKYDHYSLYYHLSYDSIPAGLTVGSFVRLGEQIGVAGNTGRWGSKRSTDDPNRGTHLHMEVSKDAPTMSKEIQVTSCTNSVGTPPSSPRAFAIFATKSTFGFEETANNWPPPDTLPGSYNWAGIQQTNCNINDSNVVLYNHINYGGECARVQAPENGYNIPTAMHISSIYLNPKWVVIPYAYHTLTLWDGYNQTGISKVISNSEPNLLKLVWNNQVNSNWNDRVKYVHNAFHNNAPWLLEESFYGTGPLTVNVHI